MNDTQDIELKPCPCCGAKAEFTSGYYNDLLFARVGCTNCLASTYADSDTYYNHTIDKLEEMVIEAWNRRTALSATPRRNCDVGTDNEQIRRWKEFCDHYEVDRSPESFARWAQGPYFEEGGAK